MKKSFIYALCMGVAISSCTSEEIVPGGAGSEQEVSLTLNMTEQMGSRSDSHVAWTESGKGGVSNGLGEDVVFNVGLYLDDALVYSESKTVSSSGNGTSATFTPTLIIGETYRVVAYAEFGNEAESNLETVGFKQALNDETADAYYVSKELVAAPQLSAELTRPYGKLRLLADDWAEAERQFGSHIESVKVEYKYGRPTVFDAKTGLFGDVDATSNLTMESSRVDYTGGSFVYTDEATGVEVSETEGVDYKTIFVDYIPANEGDVLMPFSLTVTFADGDTYTRDFRQDIPVRRNWLTTLKGDLFTMGSELTLYIEEDFDNEEVIKYDEELAWILANGGTYTLQEDLEIEESLVVAEGASVVIDLNGNDIINTTNSSELGVGDGIIVYGSLVLQGEGTVQGNTRTVWARGNTGAKVTIKGGTYIGAVGGTTEVIYASGNGVIDIYGGTFEAKTLDETSYASPQYAVLNIHGNGKTGCDINVYGGVYVNFDPANNVSENPKAGYHDGNFVADGYKSIEKDGNYYVVPEQIDAVADNSADLIAAIQSGESVVLTGDVTLEGKYLSATSDEPVVIKAMEGVEVKLSGAVNQEGPTNAQCVFNKGNITFEDITFSVPQVQSGWVVSANIYGNANVTFRNCTFAGKQCAIYQSGNAVVTLEGCNFDIDYSDGAIQAETGAENYLGTKLTIKDCDFGTTANVLTIFDWSAAPMTVQDVEDYLGANGNIYSGALVVRQ